MIQSFKNISLRFKLIICFLVIITINSIFGVMSVNIMQQLSQLVNMTYDKALMSGTFAQASKFDFAQYDSEIKSSLLSENFDDFKKHQSKSNRIYKTLVDDLEVVKERALSTKSADFVGQIFNKLIEIEKIKIDLSKQKEVQLLNNSFNNTMILEKTWDSSSLKNTLYKDLTALYDDAAEVGYQFRLNSEESNKKNLTHTIWILVFCSAAGLFLAIGISYIIIVPLFKLKEVCKTVGAGNYTVRADGNTRDEFGTLARSFNFMLDTIQEKDENISSLLSSLPFGLFYFNEKGIISKERSLSTDLIFKNFNNYLSLKDFYTDHGLGDKRIQDIINATFQNIIPFDQAVFLFPDIIVTSADSQARTIELSFKPKYNNKGKLEKVILIAEDITEKNRAMVESEFLTERVERVSKISYDIPGFKEFVPSANALFIAIKTSIINNSENQEVELKRNLHSLKGLLGIFSFNTCAKLIHKIESLVEVDFKSKLDNALNELDVVRSIFEEQTEDIIKLLALNDDNGLKYYSTIKIQKIKLLAEKNKNLDIITALNEIDRFPIEKVLAKYSSRAEEIANRLEDKQVKLVFESSDEITYEEVQKLDSAIVHVLNNSIDHGIEERELRLEKSKNMIGEIRISCKRNTDDSLELKITDDGRGIDGNYLLEKALAIGMITPEKAKTMSENEKLNLIFISGFTSKAEATETSGRGIGMDAVKSYIESIGGTIHLTTKPGQGTTFSLTVPAASAT